MGDNGGTNSGYYDYPSGSSDTNSGYNLGSGYNDNSGSDPNSGSAESNYQSPWAETPNTNTGSTSTGSSILSIFGSIINAVAPKGTSAGVNTTTGTTHTTGAGTGVLTGTGALPATPAANKTPGWVWPTIAIGGGLVVITLIVLVAKKK